MRNEEEITTSEETEVSVLDATPIEETPMTTTEKPASQESKFQEIGYGIQFIIDKMDEFKGRVALVSALILGAGFAMTSLITAASYSSIAISKPR